MNKYQEAYSYIKHYCELDDDFLKWPLAEKSMKAFKELVDKATPKKVILYTSKITDDYYTCPECRMLLSNDIYCPKCGQKLDWSDEEGEVEDE